MRQWNGISTFSLPSILFFSVLCPPVSLVAQSAARLRRLKVLIQPFELRTSSGHWVFCPHVSLPTRSTPWLSNLFNVLSPLPINLSLSSLSGAAAGALATIATHPPDVVSKQAFRRLAWEQTGFQASCMGANRLSGALHVSKQAFRRLAWEQTGFKVPCMGALRGFAEQQRKRLHANLQTCLRRAASFVARFAIRLRWGCHDGHILRLPDAESHLSGSLRETD